ncbi:hypothetical protein HDV00_008460 [Rhizophlyctis rosea]|nr:hypothetical protein HDV00_008460 [Rhizophlyctis rosea]
MTGNTTVHGDKENEALRSQGLSREEQLRLWKQQKKTNKGNDKGVVQSKASESSRKAVDKPKKTGEIKRGISEVIKVSGHGPQESEQTKPGPVKRTKPQPLATKHVQSTNSKEETKTVVPELKPELLKRSTLVDDLDALDGIFDGDKAPEPISDTTDEPNLTDTTPIARLQHELESRQQDIEKLEARLANECRRSNALELELKAQTQNISQVRAALKDTSGKLRTAETELLQTRHAHKDLELLLVRVRVEHSCALRDEQGKVRDLQQQHAQKDAQITKLETELQALRAQHVEKETEMNALREYVGQMEHQLEDPRTATDTEKNNSEQQSLERIGAAQQSTREIQTLYDNLQQEKSAVEARLDEVVASLREAEANQEELREAHGILKFQYAEVLIERDQQSAELRECYEAMDVVEARLTEYEGKEIFIDKAAANAEEQEAKLLAVESEVFKLRGDMQLLSTTNEELRSALASSLQENEEVRNRLLRLRKAPPFMSRFSLLDKSLIKWRVYQLVSTAQQTEFTSADNEAQTELDLNQLLEDAKEATKSFHAIKFAQSIMRQQMEQNQTKYANEKLQLEEQMRTENQKWRDFEATQAEVHKRLLEALQQSAQKKRETEVRLKEIERVNALLRERIIDLGGDVREDGMGKAETEDERSDDGGDALEADISVDLGPDTKYEGSGDEDDEVEEADGEGTDDQGEEEHGEGSEEEEEESDGEMGEDGEDDEEQEEKGTVETEDGPDGAVLERVGTPMPDTHQRPM